MNEAHDNAQAVRPVRGYSAWLVGLLGGGLPVGLFFLLLLLPEFGFLCRSPVLVWGGLLLLAAVACIDGLLLCHWARIVDEIGSGRRFSPPRPAWVIGAAVAVRGLSYFFVPVYSILWLICTYLLLARLWQAMEKHAARRDKCALAFLLASPGLYVFCGLCFLQDTSAKVIWGQIGPFSILLNGCCYGLLQYLFDRGLRIRHEQGELTAHRSIGSIQADLAAGAGCLLLVEIGILLAAIGLTARG